MNKKILNYMRITICILLALPILGMIIPTTFGFWNTRLIQTSNFTSDDGYAPVAQSIEGETFVDIYAEFKLSATDADGDAVMFKIVETPKYGIATIEDNTLKYKPTSGKTGTDKFSYAAVDAMGNSSEPAEIAIKIKKNPTEITYEDMQDNNLHYAAISLADQGVFVGEKIGASYFFNPNEIVTRSEFIAMAVSASDLDIIQTNKTDFIDDSGISDWVKPYIQTAVVNNMVCGYTVGESYELRGANAITLNEAVVIAGNLSSVSNEYVIVTSNIYNQNSSIPVWVSTAANKLITNNVIDIDLIENEGNTALTREMACKLLYNN